MKIAAWCARGAALVRPGYYILVANRSTADELYGVGTRVLNLVLLVNLENVTFIYLKLRVAYVGPAEIAQLVEQMTAS